MAIVSEFGNLDLLSVMAKEKMELLSSFSFHGIFLLCTSLGHVSLSLHVSQEQTGPCCYHLGLKVEDQSRNSYSVYKSAWNYFPGVKIRQSSG